MNTPAMPAAAQANLDRAASLLAEVARDADDGADPALAVRCLCAADQLTRLGAHITPVADRVGPIADILAEASRLLAALPPELTVTDEVLDAAGDIRRALSFLS